MNPDIEQRLRDLEDQVNLLNPLMPSINNTINGLTQNVLVSTFFTINGGSSSSQGGTYSVTIPHHKNFIPAVVANFNVSPTQYRQIPGIRAFDLTTVDTNGSNDGSKIIGIWEWCTVIVGKNDVVIEIEWANPSWYPTSPGTYTVAPLNGHLYITNIPLGTEETFVSLKKDNKDHVQASKEY